MPAAVCSRGGNAERGCRTLRAKAHKIGDGGLVGILRGRERRAQECAARAAHLISPHTFDYVRRDALCFVTESARRSLPLLQARRLKDASHFQRLEDEARK